MKISLIVILVILHVFAAVFWAGSTFTLARLRALDHAVRLFWPQLGSAALAFLTGFLLWGRLARDQSGTPPLLLSIGAFCAILAVAVQAILVGSARRKLATPSGGGDEARNRIVVAEFVASVLLAVTLMLMTAVRFL